MEDQQNSIPKDATNRYMFFGTVVSTGKDKNTYVKWDILPVQSSAIKNITRTKLTVMDDGEEEKAIPDNAQLDEMEYDSDKDAADGPQKSAKKAKIHVVKWTVKV
jgi:hypothetical protein